MAGLPMPARSREGEARDQRRAILRDALALAAEIFETTLNAPVGAKARGYLADRGVDPAAAAPVRPRLRRAGPFRPARGAGGASGVDLAEMIDAGLLAHGEDIAVRLRPLPRPGDVPDPRPRRQARRLRRPRARSRRQGEIPQLAGDRALPQRRAALQPPPRPQGGARARRGHRRRGLCRRHRHDPGGLRPHGRAARHRADQRAMRAAVDDAPTSRSCASTATRRDARRPTAPSTSRCR